MVWYLNLIKFVIFGEYEKNVGPTVDKIDKFHVKCTRP